MICSMYIIGTTEKCFPNYDKLKQSPIFVVQEKCLTFKALNI